MQFRCSDEDVQSILGDNWQEGVSLLPFRTAAATLVDKVAANDTNGVMGSDDLQQVETWLAAHFYCVRDPEYMYRSTLSAKGQFAGKTEFIMKLTRYGQMAMMLDETGWLARRSAEAEAGVKRVASTYALTTEYNFATANPEQDE